MSRLEFELDTGLTLLRVPSVRSTVLHRVACAQLCETDGAAYWIDARNTASTHTLYECAVTPHSLEGLEVARAFTAYQHHSLVREVARVADGRTNLLVAPNVADLYRDDDLLEWERADLLAATLVTLRELGRALECPVLVTAVDEDEDELTETVAAYADHEIECIRTREGIRFEGEDVCTEGYFHGTYWQTTIPYWVELCGVLEAGGPIDPVVAASDRGLLEIGVDA